MSEGERERKEKRLRKQAEVVFLGLRSQVGDSGLRF